MPNYSAGSGEPYWYEWTVGLLKIVEMLHPDSDIDAVVLQAHGPKGWDDVVVQRKRQRRDWYQIKHSRAGTSFTFGSLVARDSQGSLLENLFSAWKELKLDPTRDRCILFTNREAGERATTSDAGVKRPPLLQFVNWLKPAMRGCRSLAECLPPEEWSEAWTEWIDQVKDDSQSEAIRFLSSFEVQTNQDDLQSVTDQVLRDLARSFGITEVPARPLLHALDHALRDWTRTGEAITAETVMDALALEEKTEGEHRAPPPPAPFFPSREPFLRELERLLIAKKGPAVLFLSAEPGAGKTSALSELANRRTEDALHGVVGIRYFAFRPITPDSPVIPPDSDRFVKAEALWFDLLRQLRRGLRGRLRAYDVPVRDELLSWPQARDHVLRLASRLGKELRRPFVIAIDGIDHAARAQLHDPAGARDFFASLPSPEELSKYGIRVLLAGQPAQDYPQYPQWLRSPPDAVQVLSLNLLEDRDILILLESSAPHFPFEQRPAATRVISEVTRRNTLGVVFAAAEAASCDNAEALQQRLHNRQLQSGVTAYYQNIWDHCVGGLPDEVGIVLAGAIALARERITGVLLESAFAGLNRSAQQWNLLLGRLGPLLIEEAEGYRVRHNDLRVFLQASLAAFSVGQRREIASGFVEHYIKPTSNRRIGHESLLFLLRESGRIEQWPRIFTVAWVMEAAALGFDYDNIEPQCIEAIQIAIMLRDWDLLGDVACACETLERWRDRCEGNPPDSLVDAKRPSPTFLRTEVFVRPLNQWESSDLRRLGADTDELLATEEPARAKALLNRWLGGLDVATICRRIKDGKDDGPSLGGDNPSLGGSASESLEQLGAVCRRAGVVLAHGNCQKGLASQAAYVFEKGWFAASCQSGDYTSLQTCFLGQQPRFVATVKETATTLANRNEWSLLRQLLIAESGNRKNLEKHHRSFCNQAAWWALRSGAAHEHPEWLDPVIANQNLDLGGEGSVVSALALARARGWTQVATEIATIGDELVDALNLNQTRAEYASYYGLWLRAAATIGRIHGVFARSGVQAACEIVRPRELQDIAAALWDRDHLPIAIHSDWFVAGQLSSELIEVIAPLSEEHVTAVLRSAEHPLESWPIDYRRHSLWNLLRNAGRIDQLRKWLEEWIGNKGLVLSESASEREYTVEQWSSFAVQIGAQDVVDRMRHRLAGSRISYRTDSDETFSSVSALLEELLRREPNEWTNAGLHVWSLVDAAYGLGCGNNYEDSIETSLAKAALRSGPEALVQLILAEEPHRRDEYWHYGVRNFLINGLSGVLREGHSLNSEIKLTLWCLAVGFCRWFQNGDIQSLRDLRAKLVDTAPPAERSAIIDGLGRITPAEAVREPRLPDDTSRATSAPDSAGEQPSFDELLRGIQEGGSCLLPRCLALVREILRSRYTEAEALVPMILRSAGRVRDYSYQWRFESKLAVSSVNELAILLSDAQLWPLVEAACNGIETGGYWLQGVTDNIHVICAARAAARGVATLRSALNRHIAMHERWIRGLHDDFPFKPIVLPAPISVPTWEAAAAHVLLFLLNSRSGEIIASAIHGIHCLVAHKPQIMRTLFELGKDDQWKARWLLNASEAWAATTPDEVESCRPQIKDWLENGPLEHRLQSWVTLASLALRQGGELPSLPWPDMQTTEGHITTPRRDILEFPDETVGLMHISRRHRAAGQQLDRLEAAVGDLTNVRHRAAVLLDDLPVEKRPTETWPESNRQHGDTHIGLDDIGLLVGRAIDDTMPSPPIGFLPRIAQAFLPNEDSWMLRNTPFPDTDLSGWPDEGELGSWQQPPDVSTLRQKLLLLACEHGIASDERVLAARIEVYSAFYDVHFNVWWEQQKSDDAEVHPARLPTTISARTCCWWLRNWWQPSGQESIRPLAYVPGGFSRLQHCFVDWFPSQMWIGELGWKTSPNNPLIWTAEGKPVAHYERLHGRPRNTQNYHGRQPILARWRVKQTAFTAIHDRLGNLRQRDDIAHAPSPER